MHILDNITIDTAQQKITCYGEERYLTKSEQNQLVEITFTDR